MKKTIFIILSAFVLLSCGKDTVNNAQSEFLVLEEITKTPIAGVTLEGYKCDGRDWLGNCNNMVSLIGTTTTDNDGKAHFSNYNDIQGLKTKRDKYWDHQNYNPGLTPEFYLTPVATLKVHITKVNEHPVGSVLVLQSQIEGCNDCIWQTRQLSLPDDATIYMKGGGFYNNSIGYYMAGESPASGHSTPSVMINRFDTAQFEINY